MGTIKLTKKEEEWIKDLKKLMRKKQISNKKIQISLHNIIYVN